MTEHADHLVTLWILRDRGAQRRTRERRSRIGRALQCRQRRAHEQLEADEHRHRVPRDPEEQSTLAYSRLGRALERTITYTKAERLARLQGDPPEELPYPELALDLPHQVMSADRYASGAEDH